MKKWLLNAFPEFAALDHRQRQMADRLLRAFPQWEPYARLAPDAHSQEMHFEIRVPAPVPREAALDLLISTERGELTVYFDEYHRHFARSSRLPLEESLDNAVAYIRAILNEEIVVGRWIAFLAVEIDTIQPGQTPYIRSWRGTYNRQFDPNKTPA